MKKVFAAATGLLMLGAASQASAYWETGNLNMAIYDLVAQKEIVVDLGAVTDWSVSQTLTTIDSALLTSLFGNAVKSTSGIGIFTNTATVGGTFNGYLATAKSTAPAYTPSMTIANKFTSGAKFVQSSAAILDTDADGIVQWASDAAGGYNFNFNFTSPGGYAGMNPEIGNEGELNLSTGGFTDMYVYHYNKVGTTVPYDNVALGAKIRINADGTVALIASEVSEVPVPGAIVLLGSGLAGLVGIRRRKNS